MFVLVLLITIHSSPADAVVKAGAACKQLGITSMASGKTFTCIKLGKKLVWDKGFSKNTAATVLDIPISIDNLDLKGVPQKAHDNVSKVIRSSSTVNFKPTIFAGPNVNKIRIEQEVAGLNRVIAFWAPYFIPEKLQIIYVDRGDETWLDQKSAELGLSTMVPMGQTWKEQFTKESECAFGMAGSPNGTSTFVQCLGFPYGDGSRQGAPHEYTHLYQLGVAKSNGFAVSWYTEGSATFFGWSIAMYGYDPQSEIRKNFFKAQFLQMNESAKSDFTSRDLSKFKSRMQALSGMNTYSTSRSGSYWAGGLAYEVLIALYGIDKFVELTKNLESNQDISSLLKLVYGFDADYFYTKLAPYVWAQIPSN